MAETTINQLREDLRQAELWASVTDALLIAAENDKHRASDHLAAARIELLLAEETKRGEA
ncbi:MAG: hypothetical protein D3M94_19845 [Rhodocyclales bacterium GT-UBC]|nr:MAG: hypothetical protein D3M94_19845 [Rhodocyclales bacterium GT-UBC]